MRILHFSFLMIALLSVSLAWAQPSPIDAMSDRNDSIIAVNGPDGKPLPDGSIVFALRAHYGKPSSPKPGVGVGEDELLIQKGKINPGNDAKGQLYMILTANTVDMYFHDNQAIKGENIFFRVFATTDTLLPSGTPYSDSPFYLVPASGPGQIKGIHFDEWKQIP